MMKEIKSNKGVQNISNTLKKCLTDGYIKALNLIKKEQKIRLNNKYYDNDEW